MAIVLDAGALLGIDRRDRALRARITVAQTNRVPLRTSAAALAQIWRDGARQANLARLLRGVGIRDLDAAEGRRIGELLGRSGTSDVVDGHVALITEARDIVLTSNDNDLRRLLTVLGTKAAVVRV